MSLTHLLREEYGLAGELARLAGSGETYRLDSDDGRARTVKVEPHREDDTAAAFEAVAMEHAADHGAGLDLPAPVRTINGQIDVASSVDGRDVRVRVLDFVPGTPWCEAGEPATAQFRDLGQALARLDQSLLDFDHPGGDRSHAWDLTRAGQHRGRVPAVDDPARRDLLDRAFHLHASVVPALAWLPWSIIHADVNDENVLVDDGRVTGLVDFGDCLLNPVVCELAIALAYAMLDVPAPLDSGAGVVAGYHAERPLSVAELEVLFPLICGRLAVTVAVAADRRRTDPDHPTWFVTEERAWALLERLDRLAPADAARRLAAQVDLVPYEDAGPPVDAVLKRRHARISGALSVAYRDPVKMVRGRGQFLFDDEARPYLDLVNNVCHVGHCHPRVVEAGHRQMSRLNTNTRYLSDGLVEYADRLVRTMPEPLEVCIFVNSGTEANELALRLARAHTGRRDVVVVEGAYHGHTGGLIDISPYKFMGTGGAGRPEPWVHPIPVPDVYRGRHRAGVGAAEAYVADARAVIDAADGPVAAFITESLLSCGGQVVPPEGWLAGVFDHVRRAGGVCIADEVQTGFGRVGSHFWAFEAQGVVPDIVVLGKPMGNGHPIGAVVMTRAVADSFENGMEFFSTFGGNPVSCAIGLAVLDVIEEEGLQAHALDVGRQFHDGFTSLMDRHSSIGDVRGLGLFLGVELVTDRQAREPATSAAAGLVNRLRHRGILASTDGPHANVIKIKPPLVIDENDVEMAVRVIGAELGDGA